MSEAYGISFDPKSLSEMAQFYGFSNLLTPEVQRAMTEGGDLLAGAAEENTWHVFEHPTGKLASTIHRVSQSPYEVIIGSESPYARRRELGFSGRTDRLGRYFAHDPGKPYIEPALTDKEREILILLENAFERALKRIGG